MYVFLLPLSLFLSLATSSSLHTTSLKTQQNKKELHRVLENKCFQQTSSIKAINQVRLDYSSLVSCGQQHWEPWRAILIPLMKAMRNSTAFDFGWVWNEGVLSQDTMVTMWDLATGCLCVSVLPFRGYVCFSLCLYEWPCNIVYR